MLNQLEQVCKTYSTESSSGLIDFDSNWQRIFVTTQTFRLDQAIPVYDRISEKSLFRVAVSRPSHKFAWSHGRKAVAN